MVRCRYLYDRSDRGLVACMQEPLACDSYLAENKGSKVDGHHMAFSHFANYARIGLSLAISKSTQGFGNGRQALRSETEFVRQSQERS